LRGEFDMCRNGRYRERGIKELDGFGAELVTLERDFAIKIEPALGLLGVLTEPTSVVAKAWEQVDLARMQFCRPVGRALVTGAGPIGLLAALLGVQRGLEVHVLDRAEDGPKRELAEGLGATYHSVSVQDGAVVSLLGVSPAGRSITVDAGTLNNELVLENDIVFGSVNANHRHFQAAASALAAADAAWLEGLITRRVPLDRWDDALERRPDDIKNVIEFAAA
jgi:threonine dehydrogenase-like Zn-dependent dehydrogenase